LYDVAQRVLEHQAAVGVRVVGVLNDPIAIGADHEVHRIVVDVFAILRNDEVPRRCPLGALERATEQHDGRRVTAERPATAQRLLERGETDRRKHQQRAR